MVGTSFCLGGCGRDGGVGTMATFLVAEWTSEAEVWLLAAPGRCQGVGTGRSLYPGITLPFVARERGGEAAEGALDHRLTAARRLRPCPAGARAQTGLSFADCMLGDPQNGEQPRRSCTIYRPWFSPYSYFVCVDKESYLEAHSFPELPRDEGRGDSCLPEDAADSLRSSSSSPDNTSPREATKKPRHGDATDHITSQDILRASRWLPAQQNGFKCAACCRMYPTLCSLKSHIRCGFREGFSCRVFYRKLKALWARPADRLSLGGGQARK